MRSLVALLAAVLLAGTAHAQVLETGTIVPGHAAKWVTQGAIGDAGGSAGGPFGTGLTELGITNSGLPFCINDGPTTSPYHQFCLGANVANGGAFITYNPIGGASPLPLTVNLNGVNYPFPGTGSGNVVGPSSSTIGDAVEFNNTTGTLLKDAGAPPLLANQHIPAANIDPLAGLPCFNVTTGGICLDPQGPNEFDLTSGGDNVQTRFWPGGALFQNNGSYQVLSVGRTDAPLENFNFPVAEFDFAALDSSAIKQNACAFYTSMNSGTGLGPLGDLGSMTIGCNVNGVVQPAVTITGGQLSLPGGLNLTTALQPPAAGDGEIGGYKPLDLGPSTNLMLRSAAPCTSPWTATNVTCGSATQISPDGSADMTTLTDTASGANIAQTATVPANQSDYYGCSIYVHAASAAAAVRINSFSGTYAADYTFATGQIVQTAISAQAVLRADADPTGQIYRLTIIGQNPNTATLSFGYFPAGAFAESSSIVWGPQCELMPVVAQIDTAGSVATSGTNSITLTYAPPGLVGKIIRGQVAGVPEGDVVTNVTGNVITIGPNPLTQDIDIGSEMDFIKSKPSSPIPTVTTTETRPNLSTLPIAPVVASLPTCNASEAHAAYIVDDATAPTYGGALTGGGSVMAIALCDGTSWKAH